MNINNPTTFGSPGLTLSTSNSSGTGGALRSDDTIAVFDGSAVASVGASNTTGSQAVASRRDHVHSGIGGAGTVVDEAIARFNGTSGASLQGYSSLSPTISDAGIITLTSGALKFPATAIASSDDNTLDDYQEGTWTPVATDESGNAPDAYTTQVGAYTKIGNRVFITGTVEIDGNSNLVSGQGIRVGGLPFTPQNTGNLGQYLVASGMNYAITAGSSINVEVVANNTIMTLKIWDVPQGVTGFLVSEFSDDGQVSFSGHYIV